MFQLNNQLNDLKKKNSKHKSKPSTCSEVQKKDLIQKKTISLSVLPGLHENALNYEFIYKQSPSLIFKKSDYTPYSLEDKRGDKNLRMNALLPKRQLNSRLLKNKQGLAK